MTRFSSLFSLSLVLSGAGCGSSLASLPPDAGDGANTVAACQPVAEFGCFLPYPSSYYLKADATTPTGYRVAIPSGALPANQSGVAVDASRYNLLDGFSPASTLLADVGPVDATKLPGLKTDPALSLLPTSAVQLLESATGTPVPLFAEMDANQLLDGDDRQALLIHPLVRLKPATRYVVALVGLTDPAGAPIVIRPFRALVDGTASAASPLASQKARYGEILDVLKARGLAPAQLTLAWDFRTASDASSTGNLLFMRDAAFARAAAQQLGYTATATPDTPGDGWLRVVDGTFDVPSFLTDPTLPRAGLNLDAAGKPKDHGDNYKARLLIHVPQCALKASAPLPILVYGHGLFGTAEESGYDVQKNTANVLCMVYVATDWTGMATPDALGPLMDILGDFGKLPIITDRLQQGQLNFLSLARFAVEQMKSMKELRLPDGAGGTKPIVDGKAVYYYGNSQGGIAGNTLMALSPDLLRGVLGVPGGVYSVMLSRSFDFKLEKLVLDVNYQSQMKQQILLALSQNLWDATDPISYVPHTRLAPLPDLTGKPLPVKQLLMQVSRNDAQVNNLAAEIVARTAGLPQLTPVVEAVYGLEQKAEKLESAFTLWDVHPTPIPDGTDTIPPGDNSAHEAVRRLPQALEQMRRFLQPGGLVEQTCTGACDFP